MCYVYTNAGAISSVIMQQIRYTRSLNRPGILQKGVGIIYEIGRSKARFDKTISLEWINDVQSEK